MNKNELQMLILGAMIAAREAGAASLLFSLSGDWRIARAKNIKTLARWQKRGFWQKCAFTRGAVESPSFDGMAVSERLAARGLEGLRFLQEALS